MPNTRSSMRATAEGAILIVAAIGIGAIVYAHQTPTHSQPQAPAQVVPTPPPADKSVAKAPAAQPQQPPAQLQSAQPQPPSQPAQGQPAGAPAAAQQPSVFDEHAKQGKIAKCANVFGGLGRLVAAGSTYSAKTNWNAEAGDAHAIHSIVALSGLNPANQQAQRAAGVVFAAPIGSTCEGTLVRVVPTTDSCQAVAAELAKQNGQTGVLGDMTLMAMPHGAQVMLVPLGSACVAVSVLQGAG